VNKTVIYGTREAAEKLGLTLSGLRYYLYRDKRHILQASHRLGGRLFFTEDDLEQFRQARRGPGNPGKL